MAKGWRFAVGLGVVLWASSVRAEQTFFFDWTNVKTHLDWAWAYSTLDPLTAGEIDGLKAATKAGVDKMFKGFSYKIVTEKPNAGSYSRLDFGTDTTDPNHYGQAEGIDWRNASKTDGAKVYVRSIGGYDVLRYPPHASNLTRAQILERFGRAVGSTTAHEMGHLLGLKHYDCFCHPNLKYTNGTFTTTTQREHLMTSGATGLPDADLGGKDRSLSQLEMVKLEYADEFSPKLGTTVAEAEGDKSTVAKAQDLAPVVLSLAKISAINVEGSAGFRIGLDDVAVPDYYKVTATKGSLLTINGIATGRYVPTVALLDGKENELAYSGSIRIGAGSLQTRDAVANNGLDSLILNYEIPADGTYYIRVLGSRSNDTPYNLLVTGAAVPEPATVIGLSLAVLAMLRRRAR